MAIRVAAVIGPAHSSETRRSRNLGSHSITRLYAHVLYVGVLVYCVGVKVRRYKDIREI